MRELVLKLAGDATLKADLRIGIIGKHAWNWLVKAVPHPVATQVQATAILDLYGDGAGIALADKYLTWSALYRVPLSRAGHERPIRGALASCGIPSGTRSTSRSTRMTTR
jgi:hypothetical protein